MEFMALKYFLLGLFVKIVTGLDDTITQVPILASVTKTRMGKVAFSIGILLAIIVAIFLALFFATFLRQFVYYRYIVVALLFGLAIAIYFDVFVHKPRTQAEQKLKKLEKISAQRFAKLIGIGFVASMATVLDDIIAYSPLFLASTWNVSFAIAGILVATLIEIWLVIYFSEKIAKLPYKEEIASAGLVLIGVLMLIGII